MLHILLFIIYIALIIAVIFIERKSPTEALLWVFVMICIPYLGAVLYLVFGSTMSIKITAYIRKKRLQKRYRPHVLPKVPERSAEISDEDYDVIRFNSVYNRSRITSCDTADIYTCGKDHYTSLFEDIKNAEECIYIEFYTIHHDMVGEALVEALAKKAEQGVKVLVMCDFIANLSTPKKMFEPLVRAGGEVIRVKPYLTHYRSHRKIVVIDHKIAYIGGMNIGKQYANMDKVKTPWRDTQVRLTGECAASLEDYFLSDWLCAVKRRDWESAAEYSESIKRPKYGFNKDNLCQFIIGGVDTDRESVKMCYLSMIRSAKKSIRIQTPYFIPDASILDALKTAAATGINIEIMVPGIKASFFLDPVTNYYCGQLMEHGAKVYKYRGYIHAKTMVVDDEICCIGSVNMDMRSLMVDDEVCGVFYKNEMAGEYIEIFDNDIKSCDEYEWDDFALRGRKAKIMESIFLLFAPLM